MGSIGMVTAIIFDLSKILGESENGVKLRLYSKLPFPNRKDRVLDDYQKEALDYLEKKDVDYSRLEAFLDSHLEADDSSKQ